MELMVSLFNALKHQLSLFLSVGNPYPAIDSLWRFARQYPSRRDAITVLKERGYLNVDPNDAWLRKELDGLRSRLDSNCPWALFEPTDAVYDRLGTGEDKDIMDVANLIGRHLCLTHVPLVRYEWGLKLSPQAVGQIKLQGAAASTISVPFFCVGKPYLVGAVLAHEMSHQWLFLRGIWYDDEDINEKVTDLTSFTTGLGKLVLNGLSREASGIQDMALKLGYLESELMLYAYHIVNKWNGINPTHSEKYLNEDVVAMVRKFRAPME